MKIIATIGLPGSGKTTWARKYQASQPIGSVAIINNDSLQETLFGKPFVDLPKMGELLKRVRYSLIFHLKEIGVETIVLDNTNIFTCWGLENQMWAQFLNSNEDTFEWKDFSNVPLSICLERNAQRSEPVPVDVIHRMNDSLQRFISTRKETTNG